MNSSTHVCLFDAELRYTALLPQVSESRKSSTASKKELEDLKSKVAKEREYIFYI